ncbi:MAG TPA: serine hydrolase domain-containing protein [Chitinophagaceae bacterium]
MIKLTRFILFFFLLSSQSLFAQLRPAVPETEGFSSARLKKIDAMLHGYTDNPEHTVAGVAAIVARNGRIVYYTAAGYRDIAHKIPLQKDDIFRIASQTKAVTAVAVMMLYEEGKILLDDPISKYIPEFSHPKVLKTFDAADSSYTTVPASREVTIRDLLTHTSGISYAVIGTKEANAIYGKAGIPVGFEPRHIRLADKMKILAGLPLMHQPGAAFTYGLSIDILGYMVEIVSGMSLKDFFRQRIFEPLGMKDTYFYIPPAKQSRLAKVYTTNEKGEAVEDDSKDSSGANTIYPLVKNGTYYSGGAGLCSTAYDYAVFLQMLENGGIYNGHRLLSPSTVRLMTTNQIGDLGLWGSPDKFGLSFEVVTENGSARFPWNPGTFSWGGFWGSLYWADPKAGIVAQIWTQHPAAGWTEMSNKFKVMVYSALEK